MSTEGKLREAICKFGSLLYMRGYAHGSTGNISVRMDDALLLTPTNSCLGLLEPERISKLSLDGKHLSGDAPSKEAFLHLAMYEERPNARGIVHLHCTHAVAVSCCCHADPSNVLPPLTAYQMMRFGRLPLVPYYRPGDRALAEAVRQQAKRHSAVLLANHGPVVAGKSLEDAVFSAEELEETAKLTFLLRGEQTSPLTSAQIAELEAAFPS
jgi:ribulose-5-phosphate 4-epimerase/fuculose-1-phosphate aldolase